MEKSLFPAWVDKFFKSFALKASETVNGTKTPLTYMHKSMLRKTFSTTLKWGSVSSNGAIVRADVVALDSSLPLKRRDSVQTANGDIPKLGMKMYLNETTMSELRNLLAIGGKEAEVLRNLFSDTKKCVSGIYESLEYMFLEALSTGVTLITGDDSTGLGIRIDFGHPDSNKYGVSLPWTNASATPIDDVNHVVAAAKLKGDKISYLFMDMITWNLFKANTQVKNEFAFSLGFVGTTIPNVPNVERANEFLQASYGVSITIIDRQMLVEQNGKRAVTTPWAANIVCFLTDLNVGTLTYGALAEESFPVKQVNYQKVDDLILLSKYGTNDPVREFTSSQALALPVLDNVDSIYLMDITESVQDTQTGQPLTTASTDASILKAINKLSDEQILIFEAQLIASV